MYRYYLVTGTQRAEHTVLDSVASRLGWRLDASRGRGSTGLPHSPLARGHSTIAIGIPVCHLLGCVSRGRRSSAPTVPLRLPCSLHRSTLGGPDRVSHLSGRCAWKLRGHCAVGLATTTAVGGWLLTQGPAVQRGRSVKGPIEASTAEGPRCQRYGPATHMPCVLSAPEWVCIYSRGAAPGLLSTAE